MFRPIAMLAILAALAAARVEADVIREQSERSDDAKGIARIQVENRRGDISVRPSPDGRIRLRALKTCRGQSHEAALRYARETRVLAGPNGTTWSCRVEHPRRVDVKLNLMDLFREDGFGGRSHWPQVSVHLVVEVPPGLPVDVVSHSADVDVEGIRGALSVKSTSGDVDASALVGDLVVNTTSGDVGLTDVGRARVQTTSGDVQVDTADRPLRIHTVSGDVTTRGSRDSLLIQTASGQVRVLDAARGLEARTTSGDVEVAAAAGAVRLATTSGDIDARLRGVLGSSTIETTSGTARVGVAPGVSADLDLDTASGSIDCALPVRDAQRGRRSLRGRLGNGGAPLRVHTVSGDIEVTSGGHAS